MTDLLQELLTSQTARFDASVKLERETLARMWQAVAATPAGRHVLEHLMREHIMKVSFDVNLTGQSLESLAMFGIHRDAQKQLVANILELAGFVPGPSTEQAHDRSSSTDGGSSSHDNSSGGSRDDAGHTDGSGDAASDDSAGSGDAASGFVLP